MSPRSSHLPSAASIGALLDALDLDYSEFSIHSLDGSYNNFTHLLTVSSEEGSTRKIIMRRYNPEKYGEGHDKHSCEFRALQLLQAHGVPAPPPLLLDKDGSILGLPGIVTEFVDGSQIQPPINAPRWGAMAATTARMLARIHQTPFTEADKRVLMDDDVEVAWFIMRGEIPDWMRADPDGEMVWKLVNEHWGRRVPTEARFAHTVYCSGNILWQGDEISAVVDWEESRIWRPGSGCRLLPDGVFSGGFAGSGGCLSAGVSARNGLVPGQSAADGAGCQRASHDRPRGLVHAAADGNALPQVHRRGEADTSHNPPLNLPPKHQGETCLAACLVYLVHIQVVALVAHFSLQTVHLGFELDHQLGAGGIIYYVVQLMGIDF